jgi:hypothetical protein
VWDTETGALGYRQPLDDSSTTLNDGGGPELDIYIADIGSIELFGYCTSDDPHAFAFTAPWAVSAYCVLDDDYRQGQYGFGQTPEQFLRVTAAHEFSTPCSSPMTGSRTSHSWRARPCGWKGRFTRT